MKLKKIASLWLAGCMTALSACSSFPSHPGTDSGGDTKASLPPVSNVIIGGGISNCSSFNGADNLKRCNKPWSEILKLDPALSDLSMDQVIFDSASTAADFRYRVDAARLAALKALPSALLSDAGKSSISLKLGAALQRARADGKELTALDFNEFATLAGLDLTKISPLENAAVRQVFVEPNPAFKTPRKFEVRSVAFQKDVFTIEIYRTFVQAASAVAGGRKPKIGVVTASSENPFNDRDINFFALKSAGADVVWLPAEGGLRQAIDRQDCDNTAIYYAAFSSTAAIKPYFHMDQVFPDLAKIQRDFCVNNAALFNATLKELDGVFFAGGNQARILESFITRDATGGYTQVSEQLKILRERYAAGKLVIAGTSAGDAVQAGGIWKGVPIPMISGGESLRALVNGFEESTGVMVDDDATDRATKGGTLFSGGGLGFFRFGALDSHFSNRGREGRLVRLVKDSRMEYGFGVDENTALVVHQADRRGPTTMQVVGEAGVFVVDARQAVTASDVQKLYAITGVRIHYLTAGDTLTIDRDGALTVLPGADKRTLQANAQAAPVMQTQLMSPRTQNFLKMTQQMGLTGAPSALAVTDAAANPANLPYAASLTRSAATSFHVDTLGRVGYVNLDLSFKPCDSVCRATPAQP